MNTTTDMQKLTEMESMNRKILKVLGVLDFISVAVMLILGILVLVASNSQEVADAAGVSSPLTVPILFFLIALVGLIEGILMFRCAKDGRHSTLLIIFAAVSVVVVLCGSTVSFDNWSWSTVASEVFSLVLDFLTISTALQLRKLDTLRNGK